MIAPDGFAPFGFHETLCRGIRAAGFTEPRPIQRDAIPAGLEGRDILGLAQTGTGKTAAFALPLLQRLVTEPGDGPRVLVLAPTRELASQITNEIDTLAQFAPVSTAVIYGGVPMNRQIKALRRRPQIVVGCPGRVLDLIEQRILQLGKIETLVLDEADHMFDMGFLRDIRKILAALPRERQNLLFSATMPKEIRGLADDLLHRPHVVELAGNGPAGTIDHALYPVAESRKRELLDAVLQRADSAIVFTRTKRRAQMLATHLQKKGFRAVGLQGNMSQNARDRAMNGFRTRRFDILVATDIVARGIDVTGVSHVINFDVPNTPEAYTHRIGRTGRSEQEGTAYTFVTPADGSWVRATERMIGGTIERRKMEGFEAAAESAPRRGERAPKASERKPARKRGGASRGAAGRRSSESGARAETAVAVEAASPPAQWARRRRRSAGPKRGSAGVER